MSFQSRSATLDAIGQRLESDVIAFVTGDRENMQTVIAADSLRRLPRHLNALQPQETERKERLSLVLYTLGGDTNTPWPFMNFLRAHYEEVFVLVPFWAHSAGTLFSLGADKILMSRFATLSPIDPSVTNAFNPQDPTNPQNRIPIAVEDVSAYFQLAEDHKTGDDDQLPGDAFRRLSEEVHPLALGNVQRSTEQIRHLARRMIALHSPSLGEQEIADRVKRLTTEMWSHSHLIPRDEAAQLGLPAEAPEAAVEQLMLDYYDELKIDLSLLDKFESRRDSESSPAGPAASNTVAFDAPSADPAACASVARPTWTVPHYARWKRGAADPATTGSATCSSDARHGRDRTGIHRDHNDV